MKVLNRLEQILTPRQYEIAEHIARGYAEKEIADKLHVSYDTVHTHARNIRQAINARCNVDIAREFILSLDNPREYFASLICALIMSFAVFVDGKFDIRNARRAGTPIKVVRLRSRTQRPKFNC